MGISGLMKPLGRDNETDQEVVFLFFKMERIIKNGKNDKKKKNL